MSGNDFKFDLGDVVKDTITGFSGVVVYRTQWLNNCNVYGLLPQDLDKDGRVRDKMQFDEPQLVLVKAGAFTSYRSTGGDREGMHQTSRV